MAGRKPRYRIKWQPAETSEIRTLWGKDKSTPRTALTEARALLKDRYWRGQLRRQGAFKAWVIDMKTGREWELSND